MDGQLNELEPHPAAEGARQWLIGYIQRNDAYALLRLQESFATCAIERNRLAEICSETLRRLLAKEPVSDRYLLGLVWTIRDMEQKEMRDPEGELVKELAGALDRMVAVIRLNGYGDSKPAKTTALRKALPEAEAVLAKAMAAALV